MSDGRNNLFKSVDGNIRATNIITLDASGGGDIKNVFKLIKSIEIREIYGEIVEGSITNLTAVRFTLYDGTLDKDITSDGAVLSGSEVGALIIKDRDLLETADVLVNNEGRVFESISSKDTYQSFFINQKFNVDTFIRLHYATTETPIDAKIRIVVQYHKTNGGFLELVV